MKKIFLLTILSLTLSAIFAHNNNSKYENKWKEVEGFKNKRLPKSALKVVDEIYLLSKKEQNSADFIKAFIDKFELEGEINDVSLNERINKIEKETETLWQPAKQLAHQYISKVYKSYIEANRWQLMSKGDVKTGSFDITKMGFKELANKTENHILASLENPLLLQKEKSDKYKILLNSKSNKIKFRPTLYDLLVTDAFETLTNDNIFHFPNEESSLFSDTLLLGSLNDFLKINISENQKEFENAKAINLFKEWIEFTQLRNDKEALIDADLYRLLWFKEKYLGDDKNLRFEESLTNLISTAKGLEIESRLLYEQANLYYSMPYEDNNDFNPLIKAWQLASGSIEKNPKSEGAEMAKTLIKNIERQQINIENETLILPNQPFVFNLKYKNIEKIYLYLFEVNKPNGENFKSNIEKIINTNKAVKNKTISLPQYNDFLIHSAELSIDIPKEYGHFVLFIIPEPFKGKIEKHKIYQIVPFQSTNISYISKNHLFGSQIFTAINSTTGKPIENIELTAYRNNFSKRRLEVISKIETNNQGEGIIEIDDKFGYYDIILEKGNDRLISSNYLWNSQHNKTNQTRHFIFTDRAIYRPGQTVFYKIISLNSDGETANSIENEIINITFNDVNGKEISKQNLKTNKYGSISGSFVIPNDILTGRFSIRTNKASKSINIEEYKRPKMEVTFNPFEDIKQLGDSISVIAIAKGYAGYAIQNAKVSWKIEQGVSFWRYYFPMRKTILTSGTGTTNEKGEVEINFKAKKQKNISEQIPHNFIITVDVTSPSGETVTSTKTVTLSNQAFRANAKIDETTILQENKSVELSISLENMSGEKVSENIYYTVSKLNVPDIPANYRLWDEPDTIISKSTFENSKLERDNYKIKKEVVNENKFINKEDKINLNINETGIYKIKIYSSSDKKELLETKYFSVINEADGKYQLDEPLTIFSNKTVAEIGENVEINIGSGFYDALVYINISYDSKTLKDKRISLNKEWETINYTIPEKTNGNIDIQAIIIKNNRVYEKNINITVEKKSDILNLKLSSYRDKTTPGSDEKWEISFYNGNNKPEKGEVLALLYDSSLDKFAKNSLYLNPFTSYKSFNKWQVTGSSLNSNYGVNRIYYQPFVAEDYPYFFWRNSINFSTHQPIFYSLKQSTDRMMFTGAPKAGILADEAVQNIAEEIKEKEITEITDNIEIRTELQETAFFYPFLETDDSGKAVISFTMPESLTKWRFMALAHRKDGRSATTEEYITVLKQLMVIPNLPRVVRQGDILSFNASIINNSDAILNGDAKIIVKDLKTGDIIPTKAIKWEINNSESQNVKWEIKIPDNFSLLEVTITANSDKFSDGETHLIPVLLSKVYLTETLPLFLYNKGKHNFELEKLTKGDKKEYENLTFTYTANAAWEVLSVLPWIAERPYENSDQIFNRIFSALIAKQILKEHPNIKETLNSWSKLPKNSDALKSALERNPELKSTLLSATPWINIAESETEKKLRLANFTNETNLNNELELSIRKLQERQLDNGTWAWFSGDRESPYITIEIITGFGKLNKLGIEFSKDFKDSESKAVNWLNNYLKEEEKKQKEINKERDIIPSYQTVKAIYALSFYKEELKNHKFWIEKISDNIPTDNIQLQSMVATILMRSNNSLADEILQSLQERLITQEKNFYYYKIENSPYWHSSPIETHVSAIEALRESGKYDDEIGKIQNWIINQKRAQSWNSIKATTDAVYILATANQNYFSKTNDDIIKIGGKTIDNSDEIDALGYISQSWQGKEIKSKMGKITIDKKSDTPSWASMHLSYFGEESKVEEGGFLDLKRTFYKRTIEKGKEVWEKIDNSTILKKGDRILTRIEIVTPQALDFVHVESPRASAFEPTNTISGYRWQSGFGYYESTKDSGIDFFITQLPKGENRLEYESTVVMEGKITNGPTKVSCFYAPEFSGHSSSQTFIIK